MALKLVVHISKKIPGEQEYTSTCASCSIEGEIANGQDAQAEAARLYDQAEQAVDRQLGLIAPGTVARPGSSAVLPVSANRAGSANTVPVAGSSAALSATQPSRPYPRRTAAVTDSQLRYLERLIQQARIDPAALLNQYQVGSLKDLSCKLAAQLIDELKGKVVPA